MGFQLVAVDTGRSGTEVVSDGVREYFPSILGEYRELKLEREMEKTGLIAEYQG